MDGNGKRLRFVRGYSAPEIFRTTDSENSFVSGSKFCPGSGGWKQKLTELVAQASEGERIGIIRQGKLAALTVLAPAEPVEGSFSRP